MASLTQQPLLSPLPNPEPPSFPILRDILSRKLISQEASPYGFSGGPAQEQSLYTGGGRGMFNPYSGGYGGGGGGGQQMPPQGPPPMGGGGMYGFQPPGQGGGMPRGDVFALLQQILSQGGQMPNRQPQVVGRDGYTLNNQISSEGNFDGCSVGQDAMAPAPDPRQGAALRAIMGAMMAKRRGRPMPRRPIGMDMEGGPPDRRGLMNNPYGGAMPHIPSRNPMDTPWGGGGGFTPPSRGPVGPRSPMPPTPREGNTNPMPWGGGNLFPSMPPMGPQQARPPRQAPSVPQYQQPQDPRGNTPQWGGMPAPMNPWNPYPGRTMLGLDASTPRMVDPHGGSQDVYNIESQWGGVPRGTGQLPVGAVPESRPTGTPPTLASLGDSRNNTFLNQNPGSHGAFGSTPQNWDTNSVENWFSRGQGGGQQSAAIPEGTGNRGTPAPVGRDSMSQPWMAGPRPLGGIPMGGDMRQMPPMGNTHHRIGMDSPYHDQRGPMSPLGMDAPGPGMPGPYASNFGPGGTMGDAPPSPAISAIIQLLGGGGGQMGGGGDPMMRRRPQPVMPW